MTSIHNNNDISKDGYDLVLVTGATGYIASHCVQQLLASGCYRVRGTVRQLSNRQKIAPLLALPGADDRLELVEADLEKKDDWPSVIKDCKYILHVASPWPIVADQRTVRTAVEGTINVLAAANQSATLVKVVLTSSCSAINDGHKNNRIFDENCWTDLSNRNVEFYARSKTLAEMAAWNFWKNNNVNGFRLTVLNPTFVIGPVLSNTETGNATIIARFMDMRKAAAAPQMSLGFVDVRDVARAHIIAMTNDRSDGHRILITNQPSIWFADILKIIRKEFRMQGYWISPLIAPNWIFRLYALFDKQSASIAHRIGNELKFDNTKSIELLNMTYLPIDTGMIDMVYSMIDHGLLKKTRKYRRRE